MIIGEMRPATRKHSFWRNPMKRAIQPFGTAALALGLLVLVCGTNHVCAATLSLDMPTAGSPGTTFPASIGFNDASDVASFELTVNFSSGTILSSSAQAFTVNAAFFPNTQIAGEAINFVSSPFSGKIVIVGLKPTSKTGAALIGNLIFNVSAQAITDDSQFVTLGGKVYTTTGTVQSLTPVSKTFTVETLADSDHDGMDDAWEMTYFGSLSRNGTGDFDMDGLTDLQEYQMGLNPTVFDSGYLTPGDIDNSKTIDLKDAILGLQVALGQSVTQPVYKGTDVNQDGKIGVAEIIYILQNLAGLLP